MAFLRNFTTALAGRLVLVLTGVTLLLSACSLENNRMNNAKPDPLAGTHWQLDNIIGIETPFKRQPTLLFDNNRVSGYTGCNRFFGNYRASRDGVLALGQLGMTKMACNGVNNELEQQYTQAIRKVRIYAINHSRLDLLDADHKILLTLRPKAKE